ncbi:MAG TPA: xylulokinase [Anaerolineae bacterium]|nr:xylulokinase [Anaerolineae bacterium]HQK14336.1 xylulokinase [Anaerolineae bacterium]
MNNYILAHDLGTTGNKATLYDAEGHLVGSAFYGYATEYAHPCWAEQDPEDWWQAVCASTHQLLKQTHVPRDDIACITFSGQMMAAVPLDRNARPLRTAIIWADQRSTEQVNWLLERLSFDEMYTITGHRLSESYSLLKMLWIRDHQPDIYHRAYKFVHAKDAMVARLTGNFVTDMSDASGMDLYDLTSGTWSPRILEAAEVNPAQLPEVHRSIDIVGKVLPSVAEEVGVAAGTPVVIGGGDGVCASTGAGVVAEGAAYNYVGSSAWIALAMSRPLLDPQYRTFCYCHLVPGMYMPTGTTQSAGASYQWARDHICEGERKTAIDLSLNVYDLMNDHAAQSPPGANGLLFLPYLMGERSPYWNPQARGAFVGLTIRHTHADMLRAVLEGVTMNLCLTLDAFREQGARVDAMRLIGGGAKGRLWNQIMADVYGLPIHRLALLDEATSMGAALAGGVGVGLYPGFEMATTMNPSVETIEPNPRAQAVYAELYPLFQETYKALVPVYKRLAAVGGNQ